MKMRETKFSLLGLDQMGIIAGSRMTWQVSLGDLINQPNNLIIV